MTVTGVLSGELHGTTGSRSRVLPLVRSEFRDLWPGVRVLRHAGAPSYPARAPAPVYEHRHHSVLPLLVPLAIAGVLLAFAIILGVFPHQTILKYMDPTIDRQVDELVEWTKNYDPDDGEEDADDSDPAAKAGDGKDWLELMSRMARVC